jgi:hypothetical protein
MLCSQMLASLHSCDWPPFLGGTTIANQITRRKLPDNNKVQGIVKFGFGFVFRCPVRAYVLQPRQLQRSAG